MNSNFTQKIFVAAALALSSSVVFADTVSGTGATSSQMWQSNTGSAYWNKASWDGPNMNVGSCLTSSNCGINNAPGALPYLGQANGQALTNFYFTGSGSPVTATMEAEVSADKAYNTLGWYNVLNPSQYGIIFSGTTAAGATDTFSPSAEYGLFFINAAPGVNDLYTSQASLSLNDTNVQHFAVFEQNASNYYVGVEDLPSPNSDFDYNDMVVKMSSSSAAPEPGALLLFAVGLTGLGAFRFCRKTKVTQN